jgi:hypothetical protein
MAGSMIHMRATLTIVLMAACVFSLTFFAVPEATVAADSIAVSCYSNKQYVGNITVLEIRGAANACNQMYYACKGECSACFIDYDYVEEVCVDIYNRTYLR